MKTATNLTLREQLRSYVVTSSSLLVFMIAFHYVLPKSPIATTIVTSVCMVTVVSFMLDDRDVHTRGASTKPPLNAKFLFFLFLNGLKCDAVVGDLDERYKRISDEFGESKANFWYWTQAISSLGPIAWAWAMKIARKPIIAVITWGVAKGLLNYDSWIAKLVELYRRMMSK